MPLSRSPTNDWEPNPIATPTMPAEQLSKLDEAPSLQEALRAVQGAKDARQREQRTRHGGPSSESPKKQAVDAKIPPNSPKADSKSQN